MADDRQPLHAYMTPRAHAALNRLAEDNGVSTTSLVEVLGGHVADQLDIWDDLGNLADVDADAHELENAGHSLPSYRELIKACRKTDAIRRRRGGA